MPLRLKSLAGVMAIAFGAMLILSRLESGAELRFADPRSKEIAARLQGVESGLMAEAAAADRESIFPLTVWTGSSCPSSELVEKLNRRWRVSAGTWAATIFRNATEPPVAKPQARSTCARSIARAETPSSAIRSDLLQLSKSA